MDKNLIEQYKREMLQMYKGRFVTEAQRPQMRKEVVQMNQNLPDSPPDTDKGRLIAIVTTIRSLYPVPDAKVTIFTGNMDNMNVVATDFTDDSGRTDIFTLDTPAKALSLDSANQIRPYGLYNMMVEADGYITNIHLNIPVFSSVTSLQGSNMMLLETAGVDKGPMIFDESQKYNL